MFLAMNHFRVNVDRAAEFEAAWRERDTYLAGTDGFVSFYLLKGAMDSDGEQTYASHTTWRDEQAFRAWVASDSFRKAHAQSKLAGILAGPPNLLTFTSVLDNT